MTVRQISTRFQMANPLRWNVTPLLDIVLTLPGMVTIHSVSDAPAPRQAETSAQPQSDTAEVMDGNDDIYIIPVCPWW